MYSWKSFFSVLVICVLVERHYAIDTSKSTSSSRVSPNSLRSSDIISSSDHRPAMNSPSGKDDLSRQDAIVRSFEKGLLKMFGLSSRPRPKKKVHIPAYIQELYQQAVHANREIYTRYDSDDLEDNPDLDNDDSHHQGQRSSRRYPFAGTTVRGFYHQDEDTRTKSRHGKRRGKRSAQVEDDNSNVFVFNVTSIGAEETLVGAELRLFRQNSSLLANQSRTDSEKPSKYRIGIYEIIRPASELDEAVSRLIDTRVVHSSRTKWETFDVHTAVEKWRQRPHKNHGIYVSVTSLESNGRSGPSGGHHVRLRRSVDDDSSHSTTAKQSSDELWTEQQPFLVTYSQDAAQRARQYSRRTKRGARSKHRKRSRSSHRKRKKGECRRHPLYVDFSDVGWDDWIVAPPGYRAYFCNGECGFPLPEHINATNHAIVQTLVHSVNPEAVPRPCCVPTELSSISMLYVDEHDKVTLKTYQDMVVEGCGCR